MRLTLRQSGVTFGRMLVSITGGSALAQRLNPKSSPIWFDSAKNAAAELRSHFQAHKESFDETSKP